MKKTYMFEDIIPINPKAASDFIQKLAEYMPNVPFLYKMRKDSTDNVIVEIMNVPAEQFVIIDGFAQDVANQYNHSYKISAIVTAQDRYNELKQAILNGQRLRDAQGDLSALECLYEKGELENGYFKPIEFPELKKPELAELLNDSPSVVRNRH